MIRLILLFFLCACTNTDYYIVGEGKSQTETHQQVIIQNGPFEGEVWVDSFIQPGSVEGVDVLWVIDTSGSMGGYNTELLDGIEAMLLSLPESGWRLAMISNDPAQASIESQFPLVPGDDILDAEQMYNNMRVGGREEGFDASYEYIVNNSYAQTWLRHDAALLVVFVSDEEEQSDYHFPVSDDFISWYSNLRNGSVFLSSIVNLDPGESLCNTSGLNTGDRYIEATSYFSGVIVDICSDDWSAGVTDASSQIEPYAEYELTYIPNPDSFTRVLIDGVENFDWTYNSTDNKIEFLVIPQGGALVEMVYVISLGNTPNQGDTGDTGDTGL